MLRIVGCSIDGELKGLSRSKLCVNLVVLRWCKEEKVNHNRRPVYGNQWPTDMPSNSSATWSYFLYHSIGFLKGDLLKIRTNPAQDGKLTNARADKWWFHIKAMNKRWKTRSFSWNFPFHLRFARLDIVIISEKVPKWTELTARCVAMSSRSTEARSGSSRKRSFFLESSVMDLSELEADSVRSWLIKVATTVGDGMSFPCEDERSNGYLAEVRGLIRNTHTFGRLNVSL